jgi:protocatechuate 3,4-dioxygenase beta subunit
MAGVVVVLRSARPTDQFTRNVLGKAETDSDGRYLLRGVAAGSYIVSPQAPAFVPPTDRAPSFYGTTGRTITLGDGEEATGIDIALIRGGVITGKVINHEDRPVINGTIQIHRTDGGGKSFGWYSPYGSQSTTDDRGVYRIYGLPPGRYRISIGGREAAGSFGRQSYPLTFHPETTDEAQAAIIEISEGTEAIGIDLRVSRPIKTYAINGRVLDAGTGQPVPGARISIGVLGEGPRRYESLFRVMASNENGEFMAEGLKPGKYYVFAGQGLEAEFYSDPMPIEVRESDLSGIELRARRGISLSGQILVEGATEVALLNQIPRLRIYLNVQGTEPSPRRGGQIKIAPDGSFRAEGLSPGNATFFLPPQPLNPAFTLIRIERDGVVKDKQIEIRPDEQVTGVRLILAHGSCIIRGQVIVSGGTLPPGAVFQIQAKREGINNPASQLWAQSDSRGNFLLEQLPPGQYEVTASLGFTGPPPPDWRHQIAPLKQIVTVTRDQPAQITFSFELKAKERE